MINSILVAGAMITGIRAYTGPQTAMPIWATGKGRWRGQACDARLIRDGDVLAVLLRAAGETLAALTMQPEPGGMASWTVVDMATDESEVVRLPALHL